MSDALAVTDLARKALAVTPLNGTSLNGRAPALSVPEVTAPTGA
jgi:hypothetical protein